MPSFPIFTQILFINPISSWYRADYQDVTWSNLYGFSCKMVARAQMGLQEERTLMEEISWGQTHHTWLKCIIVTLSERWAHFKGHMNSSADFQYFDMDGWRILLHSWISLNSCMHRMECLTIHSKQYNSEWPCKIWVQLLFKS